MKFIRLSSGTVIGIDHIIGIAYDSTSRQTRIDHHGEANSLARLYPGDRVDEIWKLIKVVNKDYKA